MSLVLAFATCLECVDWGLPGVRFPRKSGTWAETGLHRIRQKDSSCGRQDIPRHSHIMPHFNHFWSPVFPSCPVGQVVFSFSAQGVKDLPGESESQGEPTRGDLTRCPPCFADRADRVSLKMRDKASTMAISKPQLWLFQREWWWMMNQQTGASDFQTTADGACRSMALFAQKLKSEYFWHFIPSVTIRQGFSWQMSRELGRWLSELPRKSWLRSWLRLPLGQFFRLKHGEKQKTTFEQSGSTQNSTTARKKRPPHSHGSCKSPGTPQEWT